MNQWYRKWNRPKSAWGGKNESEGQEWMKSVQAMHEALFAGFVERAEEFDGPAEFAAGLQKEAWDLTQAKLRESYHNGKRTASSKQGSK